MKEKASNCREILNQIDSKWLHSKTHISSNNEMKTGLFSRNRYAALSGSAAQRYFFYFSYTKPVILVTMGSNLLRVSRLRRCWMLISHQVSHEKVPSLLFLVFVKLLLQGHRNLTNIKSVTQIERMQVVRDVSKVAVSSEQNIKSMCRC